MSTFKRMALIEEKELDRLRQKQIRDYNPTLKSLADIQSTIDSYIENKEIHDTDKIQLLNFLNGRFHVLYNKAKAVDFQARSPIQPSPLVTSIPQIPQIVPKPDLEGGDEEGQAASPANIDLDENEQPDLEHSTLTEIKTNIVLPTPVDANIPNQYINKYKKLISHLGNNSGILTSNANKELVVNGSAIPNSNLPDLLRSLYLRNKNQNLIGEDAFYQALNALSVPQNFISHPDAHSALNRLSKVNKKEGQLGQGLGQRSFKPPPGKRPRVLHLYRL